jgi:nitroreductase
MIGGNMIEDLVRRTRSCRRFREETINEEALRRLVDLARLSASAANLQPLKYLLSYEKDTNEVIFPELMWAGYLKEWDGPGEGERPSAYIIVLGDREIAKSFGCDHGIASQNILLGATNMGLVCCIIGSVNRDRLRKALRIPERFEILHVIALGRPGESIVIEEMGQSGSIKYWRDDSGVHHVPKRALDDIIIKVDSRH